MQEPKSSIAARRITAYADFGKAVVTRYTMTQRVSITKGRLDAELCDGVGSSWSDAGRQEH